MKILLIADYKNWAFGHIAQEVKKFNPDNNIDITIVYIDDDSTIDVVKRTWEEYDIIFIMGWFLYENFLFIPKKKVIVGIHSYCKWDMNLSKGRKTFAPPLPLIDYLNGFLRVSVISNRLYDLFSSYNLSDVYYTPNGVDCDIFRPKINMPDKFKVGIIAKHYRWGLKNITKIFIPAVKQAQVDYVILTGDGHNNLLYNQMPDFYNQLNCYICTSRSEGFSRSMLEAGACGRPIISTDVSGTEEMIISGKTGLIVDISIGDVIDKINIFRSDTEKCKIMGDNMRRHVVDNFAWEKVIPYWMAFLRGQ